MNPADITPWLIFVSTTIGTLAAVGGAMFWTKRQVAQTFTEAVLKAVTPLQESIDRLSDAIATTDKTLEVKLDAAALDVSNKLASRAVEVDAILGGIDRRMTALEIQRARDTQKVLETIEGGKT